MSEIRERDVVLDRMASLSVAGVSPYLWPERLRTIFAQACLPNIAATNDAPPTIGPEHVKGVLLAGFFWPGCITIERLPVWIRSTQRDSTLEELADHVRHHLYRELTRV
ncbi:hypothetical protein [Ferrimicrobium acidiphilum]|jgi:hypothetical protein|uniref:hypothetical protein n=1 Tax=Ferrimicrobium acidiphilum TaxID=121039 RepID=UPI0023F3AB5F|nr:hypothetical protein [Ferrimicrobium acidiphilum]